MATKKSKKQAPKPKPIKDESDDKHLAGVGKTTPVEWADNDGVLLHDGTKAK